MSSSSSSSSVIGASGPPKTSLEAAERFKVDSIRVAKIFADAATEMKPSPLGDMRIFLLSGATGLVQQKDAVEAVESFVERLLDIAQKRPESVTAYKNRDIDFVTSNEDVLITVESMRGIIAECLSRKRPNGTFYFDAGVISTLWLCLKNLIVKANNYVKLTPEKYPDGDIIKKTWY